jgi:hypothetical protein
MKDEKQAGNKILWLFAIGQLGWAILSGVITNWLVYFYQPSDTAIASGAPLFITQGAVFAGLTIIGLIAAVGSIFDAVTDPWIASCSDRCHNKLGRRIPFLRYSAVPLGIVTVLVFISPVNGQSGTNALFPAGDGSAVLSLHDAVLHAVQRPYPGAGPDAERPREPLHLHFDNLLPWHRHLLPGAQRGGIF